MEDAKNPPPQQMVSSEKEDQGNEEEPKAEEQRASITAPTNGGGWGGWGFSAFSVLSDLQKVATVAAEISRNASVVAEKAAKSLADIQIAEDSESSKEEESPIEKESEDENDKLRKSALDKLENASGDSFLGQGLKAFDNSVENFASGAWQALGSALKGGTDFVQKLEYSAVSIADSIQQGGLPAGSVPPSLIESGRAFTTKGMQVLEYVGKETMDLLINETGIEVENNAEGTEQPSDEDQSLEEVSFDRCFYIYGGPEQLEELEALSSHYALLFNRRKTKLSSEQKSVYEGKLKQIQQIFSLDAEMDGTGPELAKGKKIETGTEGSHDEMKILHDSSVSKAADMAAGFTNALAGLVVSDIIQRTAGRLESLHSEGVHRLSEMCCLAMSHLLLLGKSVISSSNRVQDEDADSDTMNIEWPEDSVEKAKLIRLKAQSMTGNVEAVTSSFITGISDVAEAYVAAIKSVNADSHEALSKASIQEKASFFSEHLRSDQAIAVSKIQDGLQNLSYVVLSTSMPAAA
ncbi:uncharacterized protein LOC120121948 isoform X1 [Hibiscus syriacus]|uniref:uncharacterized protein LOC120121948 isoform X1 n=1 Tax=Hibiscus syriacus TaxID=106335 RepID=UPI001924E83B|nr:uncharacterized protein LOC120121948 isoform X1 [Hibiscus syriacus]XP_038997140.1 uncharacterized protein LOC120121948 isoform X1 [Hibiscus syriacus]